MISFLVSDSAFYTFIKPRNLDVKDKPVVVRTDTSKLGHQTLRGKDYNAINSNPAIRLPSTCYTLQVAHFLLRRLETVTIS